MTGITAGPVTSRQTYSRLLDGAGVIRRMLSRTKRRGQLTGKLLKTADVQRSTALSVDCSC